MNKIAVFCSASDAIDPVFMEKARELGAWLGQHHKWLVYGGFFRIFFMKQTYQKFLHLLTELCQSGSPRRTIPLR